MSQYWRSCFRSLC